MFKDMLNELKAGATPEIKWEFEDATADCAKLSETELHALFTPIAKLTVGNDTIEICRTFSGVMALENDKITGITFEIPSNCPWYSIETGCETYNAKDFSELMKYIDEHYPDLRLAKDTDVSESSRKSYQMDIEEMRSAA